MNFIAVIALVAVFASQSEAWIQTTEACTAYFKAIGVGMFYERVDASTP